MTLAPRRFPLVVASLWVLVIFCVVHGYHMNEPASVISVTTNGHTYRGTALYPPALTLYQRNGLAAVWGGAVVVVALLVGWIEMAYRVRRKSTDRGVAAIIVGSLLALYSLFGLVAGVTSIGIVGHFSSGRECPRRSSRD